MLNVYVTLAALAALITIVITDAPAGAGTVSVAKTGAMARMAPVAAAAEADPILARLNFSNLFLLGKSD
jgi:hypothetical protein